MKNAGLLSCMLGVVMGEKQALSESGVPIRARKSGLWIRNPKVYCDKFVRGTHGKRGITHRTDENK